jgi:glycerol-3-phosphate dehydrogenase (NAD(P)+)
MANVAIIGGGAFGTALACVMRRSGHEVRLWVREPEVAAAINIAHRNEDFLPGIELPFGIRATTLMREALKQPGFVLMAPPAQYLRSVAVTMRPYLPKGVPVVSCSKGIERGSCALMPEVIAAELPDAKVGVLSGPSFAAEIAAQLPCAVDLAFRDLALAMRLAAEMSNGHFCALACEDVTGVSLGGVMKNVVSIASGIAAGRGMGESARATVITVGLSEARALMQAMGGQAATAMRMSGVGDMMLTANSLKSRNTSLGLALGQGRRLADVLAERREVTEGAFSTEAVAALGRRLQLDMPITYALDGVLNHGVELDIALLEFMRGSHPRFPG